MPYFHEILYLCMPRYSYTEENIYYVLDLSSVYVMNCSTYAVLCCKVRTFSACGKRQSATLPETTKPVKTKLGIRREEQHPYHARYQWRPWRYGDFSCVSEFSSSFIRCHVRSPNQSELQIPTLTTRTTPR